MKKLIFLSVLFISAQYCFAQSDMLIHKGDKGFYLEHKVTPKENFYSIGRLYNAHPKEIAAYNKLDMSKGLNLGQSIMIPLTTNFSQSTDDGAPVYYKVGEKEGLMKVSAAANNVTLANLRKWNKLETDNINFGNKLIVGYLIAAQVNPVLPATNNETVAVEKKEPVVIEKKPARTTDTVRSGGQEPVVKEAKEKADENSKKEIVENKEPVSKEPKAEVKEIMKEQPKTVTARSDGYFKESFTQQVRLTPLSKNETVTSGIFKTTSGWQDAKYYMLISSVSPGTIVKITNPTNNKVIYAKVLGEMSGIPVNEGYKIRISNAAASALEINEDDKFIVKINY